MACRHLRDPDWLITCAYAIINGGYFTHLALRNTLITSCDGSRRIVVLYGLGGIGKIQFTVAYAKRHKDNYSAVFWLNIKDEDSTASNAT